MDVKAYLDRIAVSQVEPDLESLERLQRAHLTAVPFENLHVFGRRRVRTDVEWSIPKIVDAGRGGWCFELNGAFHWLLVELGFAAELRGATVLLDGPSASPQPNHATIEVALDHRYLVDVGFGDSFIRPLRLDDESDQDGGTGRYRFELADGFTTLQFLEGGGWVDQYRFRREALDHVAFAPASDHLSSSDQLKWRSNPFATRLLDGGPDRVTLLHDRLKFKRDGAWTESVVTKDAWADALHEWFGLAP